MNTKTLIIIFIVAIVVLGGGALFILISGNKKETSAKIPASTTGLDHAVTTPQIAPFVEVTLNSRGIKPSTITVKKNSLVHFINKTSNSVEIVSSGSPKIVVAPIEAGKTGISLPLDKNGEYEFTVKGKDSVKGIVKVE